MKNRLTIKQELTERIMQGERTKQNGQLPA
jgi:hypothetical protein